jgi:electron transport complex protein RnfB
MRKKLPKELAIINADNCTGCEACLEVCPVDCIIKKSETTGNFKSWCEIDIETCVGCQLCVRIPGKKSNPYELKVCPWDAIEMTPIDKVVDTVAKMGGPPDYIEDNFDRLVESAIKLTEGLS